MTIEQINEDYSLVTVDIERQGILEHIYSKHSKIVEMMEKYPILFVKQEEGELQGVYGCTSIIPFHHLELKKLL
jgi:hypothetical protein